MSCDLKEYCPNIWTHLLLADMAVKLGDIGTAAKILSNLFAIIESNLKNAD